MKEKINIIQFMPYFPPHKGGLETVGEEIGINWFKNDLGRFINVITEFNQEDELNNNEKIFYNNHIIGYKKNGIYNLILPSFELINNFPVYKIWNQNYSQVFQYLNDKIDSNTRIITHTRFFIPSLLGGLYSKKKKLKWVHIEHGSDYVRLSSKLKSFLSVVYDRIFGKWIFKNADKVLGISQACKDFIINKFLNRDVQVFYRGLEIPNNIILVENLKEKFNNKIIIGYIGRLYKWKNVGSLINAYFLLNSKIREKVQLVIVGDGEDYERLKIMDLNNEIYFTGGKSFEEALGYQKQFDIHVHPSSPGGGLATTILQAMYFGCYIVATPNEGAKEVIEDGINGILLENNSVEVIKKGIEDALIDFGKKEKFGIENKKIINEKFSWDSNILNLYNFVK